MGQGLFAECESVLARAETSAASPTDEAERDSLWAALASRCRWVRVYYLWRPAALHQSPATPLQG